MRSPVINNSNENTEGLKKGPWTPEEDRKLMDYIEKHGQGNWQSLPKRAGLNRCGKSCRLRWTNYLRPDIKRGNFSPQEEQTIIHLHSLLGNKWSMIASHLPGRTDNEIKNLWNTHLRKRLLRSGIDPNTHQPIPILFPTNHPNLINNIENLANIRILHNILQILKTNYPLPTSQLDGLLNDAILMNPLQVSSIATNMEAFNEALPSEYNHVFDSFGTTPGLVDRQNNGIISTTSNTNTDTIEVSCGDQLVSSAVNFEQIPNYNDLMGTNNYGDIFEAVRDDEGTSSCWKHIFDNSFPASM